jgi:signal transduction histidine kinase
LVIADNGQGFHLDNLPHGNGLKNMKLRASQLGGHVEIKSEIGAGTTLQFQIPLTTNPLNK